MLFRSLIVLMVINIGISALALDRYAKRQRGQSPQNTVDQMLDEHFPDARMERIYPKAKIVDMESVQQK